MSQPSAFDRLRAAVQSFTFARPAGGIILAEVRRQDWLELLCDERSRVDGLGELTAAGAQVKAFRRPGSQAITVTTRHDYLLKNEK